MHATNEPIALVDRAPAAPLANAESSATERPAWLASDYEQAAQLLGADACRRLGVFPLPKGFVLSVVIPCFNEVKTIAHVVERVREVDIPCEVIIIDDGSTDGTRELLRGWGDQPDFFLRRPEVSHPLSRHDPLVSDPSLRDVKIVFHERNQGKGAALRTGFEHATGTVVVVQDADLEYDPRDFRPLIQPIVEGVADVVYGSRFSGTDRHVGPLWHLAANQVITRLFSLRHGQKFTDVETCYKLFRRELIQEIAPSLREQRFGIELEITAKLLRLPNVRFFERPISYARRTFAQGKKIGWRSGIAALWCILKY